MITADAAKALVLSDEIVGVGGGEELEGGLVEEENLKPVADGVATMIFPDWESAEGFFRDQENVEQARRDRPGFTDYGRRKMVVG